MHPEAAVLKFLDAVDSDLESGGLRAVSDYLSQFPDHQDRIRAEYGRLLGSHGDAANVPSTGGSEDIERVLGERYRIIESLGRGGFGEVFLAEDLQLHRRLAIKVLTPLRSLGGEWRARLVREAEVTNRIADDGLCPVYDVGFQDGVPFLVMPWIRGQSLDRLVAASASHGEGPITLTIAAQGDDVRQRRDACLALVESVARTLHTAHLAGVVHRDVKPANIFIRSDGRPILIDFGLAWLHTSEDSVSRSGVLGTPAYSAPEALHGSAEPDIGLDIWGLGVVLFELLALRRPFVARPGMPLERLVAEGSVPRIDYRFGRDLQAVLETVLASKRSARYGDMLAFADDLGRVRRGEPVTVRAAGILRRVNSWVRLRPLAVGMGTAAIALVAAGLLVAVMMWGQHREQAVVQRAVSALATFMDRVVDEAEGPASLLLPIGGRAEQIGELLDQTRRLREGMSSPAVDRLLVKMLVRAAGLGLQLGRVEEAMARLDEALGVIRRVAFRSAGTDDDRALIAHVLVLLGDAASHLGESEVALAKFREAYAVDAEILARSQDNATRVSNVAFGHLRIGHLLGTIDKNADRLAEQRKAVELLLRAEELEPHSERRSRHVVDGLLVLADTMRCAGRAVHEIEALLERADVRLKTQMDRHPTSSATLEYQVGYLGTRVAISTDAQERVDFTRQRVAVAERLAALEAGAPYKSNLLTIALRGAAKESAKLGEFVSALEQAEHALENAELTLAMSPRAALLLKALFEGQILLASMCDQIGAGDRARLLREEAVALVRDSFRSTDIAAGVLEQLGRALLRPALSGVAGPGVVVELMELQKVAVEELDPRLRALEVRARDMMR